MKVLKGCPIQPMLLYFEGQLGSLKLRVRVKIVNGIGPVICSYLLCMNHLH